MTTPIIVDITIDYNGGRDAVFVSRPTPSAAFVAAMRMLLFTELGQQACADMRRIFDEALEGMPEGAVQLLAAARADIP